MDIKLENDENEYIIVQMSNTRQVSFNDSEGREHTDDFDVTVIVTYLNPIDELLFNTIRLKYYVVLTSRR